MSWTEYVARITGGATPAEIARKTGISAPTVSRWDTSAPSIKNIRAFAAGYGRPLLDALIGAEVLTEDQASIERIETVHVLDIASLTDEELASEVLARMRGARHEAQEPQQGQGSKKSSGARRQGGSGGAPIAGRQAADQNVTLPPLDTVGGSQKDYDLVHMAGRNVGREMREQWDWEHEQDAVDPPAPEEGA